MFDFEFFGFVFNFEFSGFVFDFDFARGKKKHRKFKKKTYNRVSKTQL